MVVLEHGIAPCIWSFENGLCLHEKKSPSMKLGPRGMEHESYG
jgi:hypothetical protein